MKALKVIIGAVVIGAGAWLIFAAFWSLLAIHTSLDVYFALRFGIGLVCLASGFSVVDRATGFNKWRKGRREGDRLTPEQQSQTSDVLGLVEALCSAAVWIRSNAAETLGDLGDTRAVEPLIAALKSALDCRDWQVADSAARALGRLGDTRAVETLTHATVADDEDVSESAREALRVMGIVTGATGAPATPRESTAARDDWPLRTDGSGPGRPLAMPSDEPWRPRKSWWGRRRTGAKVALVFAGLIVLGALAIGLIPLAAEALRPSDSELVQTLMTTADVGDRHGAAVDLASRHSPQATRDLATAANTNASAEAGLAALRDEYIARFAVGVEWETLEEREEALKETAQCLGVIGDAASIDALGSIGCSHGQQRDTVRVSAVRALAETRTTDALPHLIQALMLPASEDSTGEIGDAAAAGLVLMPGAPAALIEARVENTGDTTASTAIEGILVQIGEPAVPPLVAQLGIVDWADEVLTEIGTPAVAAVSQELNSEEPIVRYRAVGVLLRLYQQDKTILSSHLVLPELVPLLIEARSQAQYGDERDSTAEAVLAAIGKPAVDPLVALLSGTDWADDVLAKIGTAAIPATTQELESDEAIVRYRALGVLLRLYAIDQAAVAPILVQPDMVPLLIEARNSAGYGDDRDADIAAVLTEIGEPAAKALVALIGTDWAEGALLDMGESAVSALVGALTNNDGNIAWGAARVLGSMYRTKPELVKGLMAALDDENLKSLARNFTFYLTIGKAGTEDVLVRALNAYGTSRMCLEFFTCGNATLETAAQKWASRHNATLSRQGDLSDWATWGTGVKRGVKFTWD